VTGVDRADFALTASNLVNPSILSVAPLAGSNGSQYIVRISTGAPYNPQLPATLHLDYASNATVTDNNGQAVAGLLATGVPDSTV
uniref:hypothetical protein n=1 Tax=Klebsiella pneumoniae TaxID=573 RepID=UPI0013D429D3